MISLDRIEQLADRLLDLDPELIGTGGPLGDQLDSRRAAAAIDWRALQRRRVALRP